MRTSFRLILASVLGVAGVAHAQPSLAPQLEPAQPAPEPETTSYRAYTMTADAISIAALAGSFASEGAHGGDSAATGPLIIHGIRGHGGRAVASWLLREGAMGAGMIIGVASATCTPDQWFCGLDRLGPGLLGGLIVASVIDAAFLTDETHEAATASWTPVLAPRQGGGTIGLAAAF